MSASSSTSTSPVESVKPEEEEVVVPTVIEGASGEDEPAEPSKEEVPAAVEGDEPERQEPKIEEEVTTAKVTEVPVEEKERKSRRATPQTPKRPREKELEGDVEMADGESPETKKRKTVAEDAPVQEKPAK